MPKEHASLRSLLLQFFSAHQTTIPPNAASTRSMADADPHEHNNGDGHGRRSHFLVVAYGFQGHLNPAHALARRLAPAARVTLSVTVAAHGRMFPSSLADEEVSDGLISYIPYSDGFDFGVRPRSSDERERRRHESAESLSAIVRRLAAAGRPVTCVVSALVLPAAEVAVRHGIPLAVFWNQSAATLAAYYHYFHGYERLVAAHVGAPAYEVSLPDGLPPLQIRSFPSFLVDATGGEHSKASVKGMRALFELIGREKPKVLVNTADVVELESTALQAMQQHLDVFAVGPMMVPPRLQQKDSTEDRIHLYEQDHKHGYMEWLDAQPVSRSVVYISYGSMLGYDLQQVEEILKGLRECGRPYLWAVPKDGRGEQVEICLLNNGKSCQGMVLEWCDQLEVLSHPSVGCFVTHCGWNSTLEAVTLGVPMVTVPKWSDQPVNAHLVEEWGVGVRAERNSTTGLLVGTELANCIAVVTGDGDKARSINERANTLKDKIRNEVIETGLVELNLQNFIISAMQK